MYCVCTKDWLSRCICLKAVLKCTQVCKIYIGGVCILHLNFTISILFSMQRLGKTFLPLHLFSRFKKSQITESQKQKNRNSILI